VSKQTVQRTISTDLLSAENGVFIVWYLSLKSYLRVVPEPVKITERILDVLATLQFMLVMVSKHTTSVVNSPDVDVVDGKIP
jgi:hypothetical protein